jgi:hypothetical protein
MKTLNIAAVLLTCLFTTGNCQCTEEMEITLDEPETTKMSFMGFEPIVNR